MTNTDILSVAILLYFVVGTLAAYYCSYRAGKLHWNTKRWFLFGYLLSPIAIIWIHVVGELHIAVDKCNEVQAVVGTGEIQSQNDLMQNKEAELLLGNNINIQKKLNRKSQNEKSQQKNEKNTAPIKTGALKEIVKTEVINTTKLSNAIKPSNASTTEILTESKDKLQKPKSELQYVNYELQIAEKTNNYPIFRFPSKGCVIRSYRDGKANKRGYTEELFQRSIESHFATDILISGNLRLNIADETQPYEPDIAIIDLKSGINMRIDVEIDEPYTGLTHKPIHLRGEDVHRDEWFISRGWIVIRFSERQVHMQQKQCLKFIALVLKSANPTFYIPEGLFDTGDVQPEELWNLNIVQKWVLEKYREKYLNHVFGVTSNGPEIIKNGLSGMEIAEEDEVLTRSSPFFVKKLKGILQSGYKKRSAPTTQPRPKNQGSPFEIGLSKFESQDYNGAIMAFNEALKLNPKNANVLCYRGIAQYKLEKFRSAYDDLLDAIKIDPENKFVRTNFYEARKKRHPDVEESH